MSISELKLELFRRIDSLEDAELEKLYDKLLMLLESSSLHKLSKAENNAINEALESSATEKALSHEEVMKEAREKYPNLIKKAPKSI